MGTKSEFIKQELIGLTDRQKANVLHFMIGWYTRVSAVSKGKFNEALRAGIENEKALK